MNWYVIKSIEDANKIYRKHPNINKKRLLEMCSLSLSRYGTTGDACVSIEPPFIEYCYKAYYENHPSRAHGKQSKLITTIKY